MLIAEDIDSLLGLKGNASSSFALKQSFFLKKKKKSQRAERVSDNPRVSF